MMAKGRILVVDDDRLVLATVAHGLAQAGYEVIDADNGDDAILLARQQRPELALLDIRMEGKTGFDVAEYLRDVAHVPFMFLSAFADADTRAKVEALGAMAYLVKPLDVGQIVPTVDQVFARLRGGAAQPVPPVPPVVPVVLSPVLPLVAPAVQPAGPADDLVPLALGILMQRFSLTRTQAAERLARLAGDKGLSPAAQAARLVEAVEDLAGPTA
jgi:two-component system, response regulator PdtaR